MNRLFHGSVWIITLLVCLGVVVWLWDSQVASARVTKPLMSVSNEGLVMKADLDWNCLSKTELDEFVSYFGANSNRKGFHSITKVESGESVLTEGYQGRVGEFVFSKITPTLKKGNDGTTMVEIRNESLA